jgi:hypothetical protein
MTMTKDARAAMVVTAATVATRIDTTISDHTIARAPAVWRCVYRGSPDDMIDEKLWVKMAGSNEF